MARYRVPLWGKPREFTTVDPAATRGATVGENLFWPDGTVVTEADFNPPSDPQEVYQTIWRLILEIPPNIVSLAALEDPGFAYMDSVGNWRNRKIGRQVFDFTFGDASPTTIYVTPHPLLVVMVRFVIENPFNGTAPELSLGTLADPELLFPVDRSMPGVAGTYEFTPDVSMLSGENIRFTIDPGGGGSAGSGQLVIDTIPLEGI